VWHGERNFLGGRKPAPRRRGCGDGQGCEQSRPSFLMGRRAARAVAAAAGTRQAVGRSGAASETAV
jgi:hypothetical protein